MFEVPRNILEYFFDAISSHGKYSVVIEGNSAIIKPRKEDSYYKPNIMVKGLKELEEALANYINTLNSFYRKENNLKEYHTLSFFLNNLFFNMTATDAQDLAQYINKRNYFYTNLQFAEYDKEQLIATFGNADFYVKRILEDPGLETPYILVFSVDINGKRFKMPLIRYAFDENNTCHLFAIQFGRNRGLDIHNEDYKNIINKINSGVHKYRNVSPSFVMTFVLFLQLLEEYNVDKILVPDFLFGRYRKYYKAQSISKSNELLTRIFDNFLLLLERMEYQFPFFEIEYYPTQVDNFTHISLTKNKNV